ncbi:MAG: tetratricopeptide repeat protein [Gammaproteobacteria bacterium]|nr:tetratricopeptide repeat protein [Gammaproteobacteria bacterium]
MLVVAVALSLAACVPPDLGVPEAPARTQVPTAPQSGPSSPVIINPVPDLPPAPAGSAEPVPAPRPAAPVSAASQALLAQSQSHVAAGRYDLAAASIERALRIDPRQPVLWLELGDIRLREGDYAQAESVGRKALSLSTGNAELTARAEALIREAGRR